MIFRPIWPARPTLAGPLGGFDQLRREMLRLFDSVGDTGDQEGAGLFPPLNVSQDNESFVLRAEVPGITAGELSITAMHNRVTITGKREIPAERQGISYHRKERAEGEFSRTVTLPTEVDADHVEARCADGVLTLKLPKAAQARPRQITVKG
jgi:HSP20 family protein